MKLRKILFVSVALGAAPVSPGAAQDAAAAVTPGPGATCRTLTDRVARLACFDTVYHTPIVPEQHKPDAQAQPGATNEVGPIRRLAKQMEASRPVGDPNWVVRVRPWREEGLLTEGDFDKRVSAKPVQVAMDPLGPVTAETADVFMTMHESAAAAESSNLRPADDQAILMLSCENDITTLGVLLPKPIETLQANLSLSGDRGSVFQLNWRDTENGDVVIAGRGLESIDTVQTIAAYGRVQLQVTYPEGTRAFVFDTADLKERLKPLRIACHW